MSQIPRKRFVINLDQGPTKRQQLPAKGKRRWPKVLLTLAIIAIVFAALAAGGAFLWWRNYQTSPAYSLALLIDAAQRNDMEVVDNFINTEKIVSDLAPQVTEKAAARYGASLNPSARKRLDSVVVALMPVLIQETREAVRAKVQEISESSERKPFIALAIALPYLVDIVKEGDDTARATLPVGERRVQLTLQRDGDRWKITAVDDDLLLQQIVDGMIKDFPPIGQIR